MYSDNETVDVASSDETEEDDDNDVNEDQADDKCILAERPRSPSLSDILNLGHNNLDFLSEIYNTAFSKVPKVIKSTQLSINPCQCDQFNLMSANVFLSSLPMLQVYASDADSIYSYNSRTGDYSSLDLGPGQSGQRDIYRNPAFSPNSKRVSFIKLIA